MNKTALIVLFQVLCLSAFVSAGTGLSSSKISQYYKHFTFYDST